MPSTIIDSAIFGDIFSSEPMRSVWSDESRTQKYLDVEGALARVQGRLGIIPKEAADEIVRHCTIGQINMEKLKQQTQRIGYPVLGVVSQLNALCRDKLGEYCHWGATTQDITDTATVLQIRDALDLIDRAMPDDLVGRFFRDDSEPSLHSRERAFDVEILLRAALVRPHVAHGLAAEEVAEDRGIDDGGWHGWRSRGCGR